MRPVFGDPLPVLKKAERLPPERLQQRERNPEKFPMSDEEKHACLALGGCRFGAGTWDKRFARDMSSQASAESPVITERQRWNLWRLVIRYRKQLHSPVLLALAEGKLKEIE